jgi:hypothetical protein
MELQQNVERLRATLGAVASRLEDNAASETRRALRESVRAMRESGMPPEQVLSRIKHATRSATAPYGWDAERWLMDHAVAVTIEELYRAD